jgi:hypothetical protein
MNAELIRHYASNLSTVDTLPLDQCCELLADGFLYEGWTRELLERVLTRVLVESDNHSLATIIRRWYEVAHERGSDVSQFAPLSDDEIEAANKAAIRTMVESYNERRDMESH